MFKNILFILVVVPMRGIENFIKKSRKRHISLPLIDDASDLLFLA